MLMRLKNLWWGWRNRCRKVRGDLSVIRSAALAQYLISYIHDTYQPCKVCGSRDCRWAKKILARKDNAAKESENV